MVRTDITLCHENENHASLRIKGQSLILRGHKRSLIHMGYGAYGYYIVRKNENHASLSSKGQSLILRGHKRDRP